MLFVESYYIGYIQVRNGISAYHDKGTVKKIPGISDTARGSQRFVFYKIL